MYELQIKLSLCNFSETFRYILEPIKQDDMANKRRDEILKKIEERIRTQKLIRKRYKQQVAEAEIILQINSILGYVAVL